MIQLAPSILSADFAHLAEDVKQIDLGGAHLIHVDVMDGHFVPNISFGAGVMKSLLGETQMPFDVHLMIENPDDYLEDFVTPRTEYITVHQEACVHLHRTLQHIHDTGVKAGVAINPATPVSALDEVLEDADLILIMSVNPGFGGQKMIPRTLDKIRQLKEQKTQHHLNYMIEIDGGVNTDTIGMVREAGTEIIVAGSAVFGAEDIPGRVRELLGK